MGGFSRGVTKGVTERGYIFSVRGVTKGVTFSNFSGGVSDRKLRGHRLQVAVFEVLEG